MIDGFVKTWMGKTILAPGEERWDGIHVFLVGYGKQA